MRQLEAESILDAIAGQGYEVVGQQWTLDILRLHLCKLSCEIRQGEAAYAATCPRMDAEAVACAGSARVERGYGAVAAGS